MRTGNERRKHERHIFPATIQYVLNPRTTDEIFKGNVLNISNRGLNLCILHPLDEGQEITIKDDLPNYHKTAVVRWIKKIEDKFYKVGLECMTDM
jgi:hypothetical protein